jgi:hypothetical protein
MTATAAATTTTTTTTIIIIIVHAYMNIVGFKFRAIHECPPSYLNAIWLAGDCP